jgi:hypothetical protein
MQQHVNEIAKCIEVGNHRVIVFDQAAWHTTSKLQVPKNISPTSITTSISGAEPHRTGLAVIERSIFRESLF